jgi:hypothetical protein
MGIGASQLLTNYDKLIELVAPRDIRPTVKEHNHSERER